MKKNLYIVKGLNSRSNPVKNFIYYLFEGFADYARMMLEVFVRSDFGERYFSLSSAFILAFVLALFPIPFMAARYAMTGEIWHHVLLHFASWYVFLGYFMKMCLRRNKEIKRVDKTMFDTERFSLSHGILASWLVDFTYMGKKFNIRQVETLIEPAFFFIVGLGLAIFGQAIGLLILFFSIIYSLSYRLMYKKGDDFILDFIDTKIANRLTVSVLVDGIEDDPSGFRMRARRPADRNTREDIANEIIQDDAVFYAV